MAKFWGIETRNSSSRGNASFGAWAKIDGKPARLTVAQIDAAERLVAAGSAGIPHKDAPLQFDLAALRTAGFHVAEDVFGFKSTSAAPEVLSWIEPAPQPKSSTPVTAAPVSEYHPADREWSPWDRNQASLPITASRQRPRS